MIFRAAYPHENHDIFRMGFDVWREGMSMEDYLVGCDRSPKYARGIWYVLTKENGTVVSSLIRYRLAKDTVGIGSIATTPKLRKQGLASELIRQALTLFESEGFRIAYLFADVDFRFYEKFGFQALSPAFQSTPGTVCMVRGIPVAELEEDDRFQPPAYF